MGIRMGQLLSPKVDFVFKRIFGAEGNQDILMSLLNAVFEDANQPLITQLEILNPFLEKDALSDKMSILDVKARTASGILVDVEIQLHDQHDMAKRTLFYWSKLFQDQLQAGDDYRQLHKAVTVNVLDFDYVPTDRYHSTFHLHDDATGLMLTDLLEVHFVELRKLKRAIGGTATALGALDVVFYHEDTRRIGGISHARSGYPEGADHTGIFESGRTDAATL